MNAAAYCRVSTDKSDQLNSLETQKCFFAEYAEKNGHNLVRLYADEGISGTKLKKRTEFLRLMTDARQGIFEVVLVKDISRFARNTVDFLQSIRQLRELGIETVFLTSGQTVLGNSEFILTIFAALAQEESANTSKRIKFGKRVNGEKGRVPNIVFGYDKTAGDHFDMKINDREAETVRLIYSLYLNGGYGASRIAALLNERNISTKRGCSWTQNGVCRILKNPLYTGKIINGKQEVKDFLTGERAERAQSEWLVTERPELRIISDIDYENVQLLMKKRSAAFSTAHERHSGRYPYSTLIRCAECGYSFRRTNYRGQARWVCSGRNSKGTGSCPDRTVIREEDITHDLNLYFSEIIGRGQGLGKKVISRLKSVCGNVRDINGCSEPESRLRKLEVTSDRYMDMYLDGHISREKLNESLGEINRERAQLEKELKMFKISIAEGDRLKKAVSDALGSADSIADVSLADNAQLRKIIDRITVNRDGQIDVYIKSHDESGI